MPVISGLNLKNQSPIISYTASVVTSGSLIADGQGNQITFLALTSSYASTASFAISSSVSVISFYDISASFASQSLSSSFASSASYSLTASVALSSSTGIPLNSVVTSTSSIQVVFTNINNQFTGSLRGISDFATSSSFASQSISASWAPSVPSNFSISASWSSASLFATSASFASQSISSSYSLSGSFSIISKVSISASFASQSISASWAPTILTISASFASASLFSTSASFSSQSISASWAPAGTSLTTGSTYPITSSWAISASWTPITPICYNPDNNSYYGLSVRGTTGNEIVEINPVTYNSQSGVFSNATASYSFFATSASWASFANSASWASFANSASWASASLSSSYITASNGIITSLTSSTMLITGSTNTTTSILIKTSLNNYSSLEIQNLSNASTASTDLIVGNDKTNANGNFVDVGINSSGYGVLSFLGNINDGYMFNTGSDFYVGNMTPSKNLYFFAGGFVNTASLTLTSTGRLGLGTIIPINSMDVVGNISCSIITSSLFFGTSSITNGIVASQWKTLPWSSSLTWSAAPNVYEDRTILPMTGSVTMSIANLYNGWSSVLQVKTPSGSNYTLILPAGTKVANNGSGSIFLTSGSSVPAIDFVALAYDGTTLFANVANQWT